MISIRRKILVSSMVLWSAFGLSAPAASQTTVFINELHYDNAGTDAGEFFEIAGPAGVNLTGWQVVLYNGNGGAPYATVDLSGELQDQQNGFGTRAFLQAGIQNGSPDGLALIDDAGAVVQFISYEGSFTAVGGPADGLVSSDIGVSEPSSTVVGDSLQLSGTGTVFEDFFFASAAANTQGAVNGAQTFDVASPPSPPNPPPSPPPNPSVFVNELHYDNTGADTGEFVEIAGPAGTALSGWQLVLYNGNGGAPYRTIDLNGVIPDQQNGFGVLSFFEAGIQNGSPDGLALVDSDGSVIQFLSYEGSFTAMGGPADGLESVDIGASEPGSTPVGNSLQLSGTGLLFSDFVFGGPNANSAGAININQTFSAPLPPQIVSIFNIQGAGHISPFVDAIVQTSGVVTAIANNGFYLQDPVGDFDQATSDALFVFTNSRPDVTILDELTVIGTVTEFQPGGSSSGNLTITEIINPVFERTGQAFALPPAINIGGNGGVRPPVSVIDNDQFTIFDPAEDGIDFYETLEGMRVTVVGGVTTGPTNDFGELWVRIRNTPSVNAAGGVTVSENDFNPERIQVDDTLFRASGAQTPILDTGAQLEDVKGVVSYSFGNYEVLAEAAPVVAQDSLTTPEATPIVGTVDQLTIASFNVENLDANDDQARFDAIGAIIVNNLNSPDIIALQEIQDNNGPVNDGVVDADETYARLIETVSATGGPTYAFTDISPLNNEDGGQPGGNIRVGYLYQPARVVLNGTKGGSQSPTFVISGAHGPTLSANPGRIDPLNVAFTNSRKPLVADFTFNGENVFVINNHFTSRGGSDPLFGATQPPIAANDQRRIDQATVVRDFVRQIQAIDRRANIVVLGDFNAFQFEDTLTSIEDDRSLFNLTRRLSRTDQYTFNFQGNAQALDHILVSPTFSPRPQADVVHVNADFSNQVTDHDPIIVRLGVGEGSASPGEN